MSNYTSPSDASIQHAAIDYHENGAPSESHTSMNYGDLPSREDFERAFDAYCPDGSFSFGNDPYIGTDKLHCTQLWLELAKQLETFNAGEHASDCAGDGSCRGDGCLSEDAGSWCSSVLGILGFEWI